MVPGDEMAEKIQVMGSTPVEEEPLYGLTYLPRKFKAAVVEVLWGNPVSYLCLSKWRGKQHKKKNAFSKYGFLC